MSEQDEKRHERNVFLFLTAVLVPAMAITIVGGYGFLVWFFQIIAGPPGAG